MKVGFIGVGAMGRPMAANLIKKGFTVTAYDASAEALAAIVKLGAAKAGSSADAARASDVVITILPSSANVVAAYLGEGGVLEGAAAGRLCVDMSTIDPATSRLVAATVSKRGTTLPWSAEPTGVAYNPANGHLFTSDDDKKRVFEVDDGADAVFGTADDVVTSFSTAAFGNTDPEDLALHLGTGDMFVIDGLGAEVSRVSPGPNGTFDGVPPLGDDSWSHFDLNILGAIDDCNKGRTATAIPYLEKRLRDNHITVPPR